MENEITIDDLWSKGNDDREGGREGEKGKKEEGRKKRRKKEIPHLGVYWKKPKTLT